MFSLTDKIATGAQRNAGASLFNHGSPYASAGITPPDSSNGLLVEIAKGHLPQSVVTAQADAAVRPDDELGERIAATGGYGLRGRRAVGRVAPTAGQHTGGIAQLYAYIFAGYEALSLICAAILANFLYILMQFGKRIVIVDGKLIKIRH